MSTLFVLPVLWKDASTPGIQGSVDIAASDLPRGRIEGSTVKDLVATVNDKLDRKASASGQHVRRVDAILLYGTRLSRERLLTSVIVTMSAYCPRLVATTSVRPQRVQKIKIFVQPPSGPPLCLDCATEETIDSVKLKIEGKTSIPRAEQLLTFRGKPLDRDRTLADYNAYSECTLHLALRLRGGYTAAERFADVSDDALLGVHAFSDRAPLWREVGWGLNLEGRCETPSCDAFGRWIIHKRGFRSFNLTLDGYVHCPMCAGKVVPLTCLFYQCMWKFKGVRSRDHLLLGSPWKNAFEKRQYRRFDVNDVHGIIAWESLLIIVQSSEMPHAAKHDGAPATLTNRRDEMCSVCWSPEAPNKTFSKISCGHSVHRACIKEWSAWCKRGRVLFSCPVCRKDLSTEHTS